MGAHEQPQRSGKASGNASGKARPTRLLLIGTMPNPKDPIGGAALLLQQLFDGLTRVEDIETTLIDTSGGGAGLAANVARNARAILRMIREIPKSDVVSLHITTHRLAQFGPVVRILCRLWGRPYIVRKFGGTDYRAGGRLRRAIGTWVARGSSVFLVETKSLVEIALADGIPRTSWYPNNRPMHRDRARPERGTQVCRRFVFVSQVRPSKGIPELLAAAERLGDEAHVDVYGPLMDGSSAATFEGHRHIEYHGPLAPDDVVATLEHHDALVLPTYHAGEGHPGIIFEAYAAGLPVIATRWRGIPEIADESSGILIEPRDADALFEAMRRLGEDGELCARLRSGVREKQAEFDSETWCERFAEHCRVAHARSA